ncbi:MAG: fructose-bisphosphate aldolase class I [Gammaproteobacteria bacterium]|nr:fructose-bisphosphate aldolase class I [Gammaproteobacteria bacterium]
MLVQQLRDTAKAMVPPGKGIIAMDESTPTCDKRFQGVGIESTEPARRDYRDMLITTPGLSDYIAGAILFDETIRQKLGDGTPFPKYMVNHGILPGIKVDKGAKDLAGHPNEKVTEGLDGLRERLEEYVGMGARFTKWRAVITIGAGIPSPACIEANAHALARYAALVQEAGLVPIVEPEVLINGDHSIARCREVTDETLQVVFDQLYKQGVLLQGMVLKPSMVISGLEAQGRAGIQEVAEQTVSCLLNHVPAAVAGVAFLSGGQTNEEATAHLNAMNTMGENLPWPLTFSYARALQERPLATWKGESANVTAAQKALHHRAKLNGAASQGKYAVAMEQEAA